MKLVGVCACTSGIAHTYMAKEKLVKAAESLGHEIHVETQGTIGTEDPLTEEQIAERMPSSSPSTSRSTSRASRQARDGGSHLCRAQGFQADYQQDRGEPQRLSACSTPVPRKGVHMKGKFTIAEIKKHLLTAISYLLPLIVASVF